MGQYLYGKNVVKQLLKDKTAIQELYLAVNDQEITALANKAHIKINKVDRKYLDKLVKNNNHQGVVVLKEEYKTFSVDEILADIQDHHGLIVVLDELTDPHNLGAILRTCDCVGVDGVIIKKNNAVGLNATVAKTSAGAIDTVKVASVTNLTKTLEYLKTKGYWVYGTGFEKAVDYRQNDYQENVVLVIGNEGKGMSRLVKESCDHIVKLPMVGKITSLNASCATAVLLYEIYNKRFPL
ncbi:MAG: 23S rRNA (guanosine(2251)-2'-O)-methyltransferase RlmB [Erysipelotrichaceae bacterium]|nr:23S rRNA (guanosine(2251)-2'-O)-methyltransferase RlmB [Erysipelotrichaceae bacterium]MDY5252981.1 23S rRNA (guanosine(2251)-2'-O)-methyltransferase RlmB [Erysipelotrichaceae bacterium]